jgi:hypothetical protein
MSNILPGDTIRLTITGNDSSILVDSWNSAIKGPVIGSDSSTLVDTTNNMLLGRHEGLLVGNVSASNGSIVLNAGADGTDAVFIGDVTGDIVGDLFGDVTGNVQGDVLADDETVLLDATNKTINVETVTTNNITLSNDLTVVNMTATEVTAGTFNGPLLGDVSGQHFGAVFGDVTGDITGDVTGNLTGNVTGDVLGDLTGNVTGDLFGDVTGNVTGNVTGTLTGDVTGNLNGDIYDATGTYIGLNVSEDGDVAIATNNNGTLSLGAHNDTLTINNNYREKNDYVVIPHPSNQAGQKHHFTRVSGENKASVSPGDLLDFKAVLAYNGTDYKTAGHWGYAVDPEWTVTNTSNSIRTIFGISVADGTNQPDILGPKKFSVNHEGIVGGYGFQASPINSTQRNELNAKPGMIIFNSSTNKFQGYNGSSWVDLG